MAVRRLLVPIALALSVFVVSSSPARGCLSYDIPAAEYDQAPTLALVARIVEREPQSRRYLAEVKHLHRGTIALRFRIEGNDGCHLPALRVGDRIVLLGGPQASQEFSGLGEYRHDLFWPGSGPIWSIDEEGRVPLQQWNSTEPERQPTVNGIFPRSLDHIMRIVGLPPVADTAVGTGSLNTAPLGWALLGAAVVLASRTRRRVT